MIRNKFKEKNNNNKGQNTKTTIYQTSIYVLTSCIHICYTHRSIDDR
jgi:hypothetical protein